MFYIHTDFRGGCSIWEDNLTLIQSLHYLDPTNYPFFLSPPNYPDLRCVFSNSIYAKEGDGSYYMMHIVPVTRHGELFKYFRDYSPTLDELKGKYMEYFL